MSILKELRVSDNPHTNPEAPHTEGWKHLADKWPDRLDDDEKDYVIAWTEEKDGGLVQ